MERRTPLQNRVTPFGEIIATPERGLFMGNRGGCFHDEHQRLTARRWATRQWITCLTAYRGWKRELMAPRRYTELFFLDEAVALSAGHRPCALCRRADFERFRRAWTAGNNIGGDETPILAGEIDGALHAERLDGREKRTFEANLGSLPDGAFVAIDDNAWLRWAGSLHRWTPGGYDERRPLEPSRVAIVLTPPSTMRVLSAGYRPVVHPSAER